MDTGAAGGTFVNVIHDLGKINGVPVDHRNAKGSCPGGVSLLTGGIAHGADMVAHPAETAGFHMLLALF